MLSGAALTTLLDNIFKADQTTIEEAYHQLQKDAEQVWSYSGFGKKAKKGAKGKEE